MFPSMIPLRNWCDPLMRGAVLFVLVAAAATTSAQVFSPPKPFSGQMDVDPAGNINVLSGGVFFSRSTDGGTTFSAPQNLSNGGAGTSQMVVDSSGNINVAWEQVSPAQLFFSRSTDGGRTFSNPINVSGNQGGLSGFMTLTVDISGNIYLAWAGPYSGVDAIFFSQSKDGGATFSTPVNVSLQTILFGPLQMAVDSSGNIYLVWAAFRDVYFARSSDGGATFSTLHFGNTSESNAYPQMALDSRGNINIVYATVKPAFVFFERSNNGGATFSQTLLASNSIDLEICCEPTAPQIAIDSSDNVSVVWFSNSSSRSAIDVFFTRSSDGGATFNATQNISNTGTVVAAAAGIAVDAAGDVNLIWVMGGYPNFDIFFSRSRDGGTTFSLPENLSNNGLAGSQPQQQLAVDSRGNINAASGGFFIRGVFLSSLSLQPSNVIGGNPSTGKITLSGPTYADVSVAPSSSDPSVAMVPSSVSVPAASSSATLTVTTSPVSAPASIIISGSDGRDVQNSTLTVLPPSLASFNLNPSSVTGGVSSATGTVTLSGPAPSGGTVVALSSSSTSIAMVPSSVSVPAGATSGTFTVTTRKVHFPKTVTISASLASLTDTVTLTVKPRNTRKAGDDWAN
jgi:hypothetical protein